MAQKGKHRIQMALEVTRGTAVTPNTLELAVLDDGFQPTLTNGQGEIIANVTFPYVTAQVPVGVTARFTLKPDVNRDNVRDLLLLATKRTSGVLPSVTVVDDQFGVGAAQYSGCVCSGLTLSASRGAAPGRENIWQIESMTFECMKVANAAGTIASLTAAVAPRFHLRHSTFLVNNVSALEIVKSRIGWANALGLGPVDSANKRLWIEDGLETHDLQHTARFTATTWRALVEGGTVSPGTGPGEAATNTIVIGTGTANETVTLTIGKAQIESRELGESDGVVTEQITLKPFHTGAAATIVPSFGSSIGLTVLGL